MSHQCRVKVSSLDSREFEAVDGKEAKVGERAIKMGSEFALRLEAGDTVIRLD